MLFAPASGPGGSGEYYRCLALARAMLDCRPGLDIAFMLDHRARVERDERLTYHELSATPARASDEVIALLEARRPALSVFDCSGRVAQFRVAQALGSRVAWISNRPRKRAKGFRPRQMRWMDLHVIVDSFSPQPRLRLHERLLLKHYRNVEITLARSIVPRPDPAGLIPWASNLPEASTFALFVAGGGGYEKGGRPVPELFLAAARRFHTATGQPAVVVLGPQYRGDVNADTASDTHGAVSVITSLPTAALGALLGRARLAVIGCGNMLSEQALAAGVPLVVTAVGGRDQPQRVRWLQRSGRARAAALDSAGLSEAAMAVLAETKPRAPEPQNESSRDDTDRIARRLLELAQSVRLSG